MSVLVWAGLAIVSVLGGTYLWYSDVDDELLNSLMEFMARVFLFVLAHIIDFFCWLLDFLPDLSAYSSSTTTFIEYTAKVNVFFPVVEMFSLFGIFSFFVMTFVAIKFVLKLIPGIG